MAYRAYSLSATVTAVPEARLSSLAILSLGLLLITVNVLGSESL